MAVTVGVVLALTAGTAQAVQVDLEYKAVLAAGGVALFDPDNDQTGICDAGGTGYTPVEEGWHGFNNGVGDKTDAFDGGLLLDVNTTTFADGDGFGDYTKGTLTVGPRATAGLRVSRMDAGLPGSPTLRDLVRLTNGKKSAVTRDIELNTDLGSDGQTDVRASSTGDMAFTKADRWVVTSDVVPSDPPVTHVLYGKGAAEKVEEVISAPVGGVACLTVRFRVRIPAKSTRYLLFFAEMNDTNNRAANSAKKFNKVGANSALLAGIGPAVRSKILNWDLA